MCNEDSKLLYRELDVFSNALDSLDMAVKYLLEFDEAFKWKWIVIASTDALYGFMIAALTGSNYARVVDYGAFEKFSKKFKKTDEFKEIKSNLRDKYKESAEEESRKKLISNDEKNEIEQKFLWSDQVKLISFWKALKRIGKEDYINHYTFSQVVSMSDSERKDIKMIRKTFRNQFVHFKPCTWLILPQDILKPLHSVVIVLERVLDCGNLYLYKENLKKAKKLVKILKGELLRLDTSVSRS